MSMGVVVLVAPALLVAFLVGSLIFSGGKASETMDTKWGVVFAYPLFEVPKPLLVILGAMSILLAVGVAATNGRSNEEGVRRLIGPIAASAVSSVILAGVVPENPTRWGDAFIGTQWVAAIFFVVALAVLLLGILAARSRERARA
ncbi:hypothetical protein M0722_08395 [Microbacterium sp. KSW4-16]|uniref:hypothetical protein n=1 Tax=Microbacterium TaxID=33882 RepID=UPI00103C31EF|nr:MULTISPECIES: hypothetical protein [Microbacterium]MCK8467205.1 hypothetical protein [Microbacterium aurugineum]QEA28394.1 hypothetical protein FGL91_07350 [Microbacterium sp. CBA3102]